jgi:hypothetical protein
MESWNKAKYCSHKCYANSKKGKIPPQVKLWKKGEHISSKTEFKKGQISPRKGVKAPQLKEHYEKRVKSLSRGEKHWNWKGGINPENDTIRKSLEYKLWHKSCLERDNFTCQISGQKGRDIVVHHINNFADFPELRFAIDNGITLSEKTHKEFHKKYGRSNNTKEQLEEFLCQNHSIIVFQREVR